MSVTISAAEVNKLRQATGAGMMDCRKVLIESEGDYEKAIDYLRKKGQRVAATRGDREAKEGVAIAIANDAGNYGVVLQLSAETDFVSKNEEFIDFANTITKAALDNKAENIDAIRALPLDGATIQDKLMEMVAKIGERIDILNYEKVEADAVVPYVHGNYRIGVLVGLNKAADEKVTAAGRDVAMQIAAMNPLALDEDSIPQEVIDREKQIAIDQIIAEGKPAELADRISAGKLQRFFKDNTLVNQPFVKDNNLSVKDYLNSEVDGLEVKSFVRLAIGG